MKRILIVIYLAAKKAETKKADSDTEKATQKPVNKKKANKNKDKEDKTPIEFGSAEDLLLIQAMNYFKGITAPPEKKSDESDS